MMVPTIHRNGTSKEALIASAQAAVVALRKALTALNESAPNARDYYPQGPDAFRAAAHDHEARITAVRRVREEMVALVEAIDEA